MKTDLARILSVSGQHGLYLYLAQARNGAIAESLSDKKRTCFDIKTRLTTLADIAIYTSEGELKLKEVFGLDDINDLPIAYNIAWYEQKAVIVLLALLYLGVKNIHLGPTLPAFLSPNVAKVLVENFGIAGISTVEEDLKFFF